MRRSREPFLWALFSGGGMLAAMVLPALAALIWIAAPLAWVATPSHQALVALLDSPLARLILFLLIALSLFHWAHRFRFTLYDGLQLYHLRELIAALTYGVATLLTLAAAGLMLFA